MNNSPVKSELYVALEMVELTQFLPFTKFDIAKAKNYCVKCFIQLQNFVNIDINYII